jgi:CheY-like chemotaxis protein
MPLTDAPILVVEDDPDSRLMIATALEFEGHPVVTATNGVEAYNAARSHRPALIVLDLMMPVMNGEEFRRAQLANESIAKIPVVVVSAHHDASVIARRLRAHGCVSKPIDIDALLAVVDRAIGRRRPS